MMCLSGTLSGYPVSSKCLCSLRMGKFSHNVARTSSHLKAGICVPGALCTVTPAQCHCYDCLGRVTRWNFVMNCFDSALLGMNKVLSLVEVHGTETGSDEQVLSRRAGGIVRID